MAISQLDDDTETIEEALARANAEAEAARNTPKPDKYPCQHCGYVGPIEIDLNDLNALRNLTKGRLVEAIKNLPLSAKSLIAACNALWDRIDGKAPQSVNVTQATTLQLVIQTGPESIVIDNDDTVLLTATSETENSL